MNFLLHLFFPRLGLNMQSSSAGPGDGGLPPLQPPHAELPPSFWEQHCWAVVIAALLVLMLLVLIILWARRSVPAAIVPPYVLARRDLEALRNQEENGVLLMKVSGILRRYVTFACGLPPEELTTTELSRAISARPLFGSDLGTKTVGFLRQCDERKFSADPPAAKVGAVATALVLVEKIERRRQLPESMTSPSLPPSIPKSAAAPPV